MPTQSIARQFDYFFQRFILRRKYMLADGLPLGMKFRFRTPDDVGRRIFKYATWEPHILSFLQDQVSFPRGGLVFDVGANLGWYCVLIDRISGGKADIYGFEPDPENFGMLQFNLELNNADRVRTFALGMTDRDGEAQLHRYADINLGRHSLLESYPRADTVKVKVQRLDRFCEENGLSGRRIALLKIDVEGLEPQVIEGGVSCLLRTECLIIEYSPMYYEPAHAEAMLQRLVSSGLKPRLYRHGQWQAVKTGEILALSEQRDIIWTR